MEQAVVQFEKAQEMIDQLGGTYFTLELDPVEYDALERLPDNIRERYVANLWAKLPALKDVSALRGMETLKDIDLSNSGLTEIGFQDLPNLLMVSLMNTPLRDLEGLQSSGRKIWYLNIYRTQVSDLGPLKKLRKLKDLTLDYCPVSDLSPLAGLKQLRKLSLMGTQVQDLAPLSTLPRLAELDLIDVPVIDVRALAELPERTIINLSKSLETVSAPVIQARPDLELNFF